MSRPTVFFWPGWRKSDVISIVRVVWIVLLGTVLGALAQAGQPAKLNPKDGLTYIWIAPGSYTMGCSPGDRECLPPERPARQITVSKGFWIGRTEVTQDAYQRVAGRNPSSHRGARLPVDRISWNDAHKYCETVGMRLPTEAEWEYAARAGTSSARYGPLESAAWFDVNSRDTTHEVARKQSNGYGLYDMLGNVWEWVDDWYQDPGNKVLRGGSFYSLASDVRVSSRIWASPETARRDIGFRCAGD